MPAGPELTGTYTDLMVEMKGPLISNYSKYSVSLSQFKRVHPSRDGFDGVSVRVPIIRNVKQGTAIATESGTLAGPRNKRSMKANIGIFTISHIVNISKRLKAVSGNSLTSWAQALKLEMQLAEEAMPRTLNEMLLGTGDGLIAALTGSNGASGGATQTLTVGTAANFYQLYPGRTGDILVRSTLARAAGATQAVTIQSVNEAAGTIVVQFDDGSNTSFAGDNTMGFYLEGVAGQAGGSLLAVQGLQQAGAQTGTFEGIDKAANQDWQGVDARNGDTATADLSISIMDAAVRRRGRNGNPDAGYWVSDPAVLDRFSQTLLTQSRWAGDAGQASTGFKYLEYRDERLYPEYDAPAGTIWNVPLDDLTFYATQDGPDWDDETGSIWQRFGRSLPIEAWLVDEINVGYHRCNRVVFAKNLNQAA